MVLKILNSRISQGMFSRLETYPRNISGYDNKNGGTHHLMCNLSFNKHLKIYIAYIIKQLFLVIYIRKQPTTTCGKLLNPPS